MYRAMGLGSPGSCRKKGGGVAADDGHALLEEGDQPAAPVALLPMRVLRSPAFLVGSDCRACDAARAALGRRRESDLVVVLLALVEAGRLSELVILLLFRTVILVVVVVVVALAKRNGERVPKHRVLKERQGGELTSKRGPEGWRVFFR